MADHANDNDEASVASGESENSYIALRAAKIARNQARLRELGLIRDDPLPPAAVQPTNADDNSAARRRRKEQKAAAAVSQPVRKSTRATRGQLKGALLVPPESPEVHRLDKKRPRSKASTSKAVTAKSGTAHAPTSLGPTLSARQIHLDVTKLLFGDSGLLGRPLETTGKAAVMNMSAHIAAADANQIADGYISFNKYSGVQEWANCIFLWINFGSSNNNQVVNEFFDNGRQVTWFGGSSMHSETPAIQKLQQSAARVILWCREYVPASRTFGPYTCLGRLKLLSCNRQTQPLEFVWNLMDYDLLVNSAGAANDQAAGRMMQRYAGNGAFL